MRLRPEFLTCWLLMLAAPALAQVEDFDWKVWRDLPVHSGGRQKPLDTLARETLRTITHRDAIVDPQSGEKLEPVRWYLGWLFDWQGWENPDRRHLQRAVDWRPYYFPLHHPDRWDDEALLPIQSIALRSMLGLDAHQRLVSPAQLSRAKIDDEESHRQVPFPAWAEKLAARRDTGAVLTDVEKHGVELADIYSLYQNHRMGHALEVLPSSQDETRKWLTLGDIALNRFSAEGDHSGDMQALQTLFAEIRGAFGRHDAVTFNRASQDFVTTMKRLGCNSDSYPYQWKMSWEVFYNRFVPFRMAWMLMLVSTTAMLLHDASRRLSWLLMAWMTYVAGLTAIATGFVQRIAISGRPPVTNMYESVIFVGAGVSVMGLIFAQIYRRKSLLTAAAAIATAVFVLADNSSLVLDPSVRPLEPALRSNFWLVTHVMTITLSYSAFAFALGIGNITLSHYLFRSNNNLAIRTLSHLTDQAIKLGVMLLAAGVVSGAAWADRSWGRFWGWDPKEVWALVALFGYLAVLHARASGRVGDGGFAVLSVSCFALVVMAWYGVNFVLGAGLHRYGFGEGGQACVFTAIALQLLYVGIAMARSTNLFEDQSAGPSAGSVPILATNGQGRSSIPMT